MLSDTVITGLFVAIPTTITAIAAAIVSVKQSNKAAEKTIVASAANAGMLAEKVNDVHEKVNGNLSAITDELAAERAENKRLREQLSRRGHRRSTDPKGDDGEREPSRKAKR